MCQLPCKGFLRKKKITYQKLVANVIQGYTLQIVIKIFLFFKLAGCERFSSCRVVLWSTGAAVVSSVVAVIVAIVVDSHILEQLLDGGKIFPQSAIFVFEQLHAVCCEIGVGVGVID